MSSRGVDDPAPAGGPEMETLEAVVERAVAELRVARKQAKEAEARADRGEELLREFVDGTQDPAELSRKVAELEAENEALRSRIRQGRQGVDQILTRIRFLEDRR